MGMFNREPIRKSKKKIRYAVVGLGHIAQAAVLPAFQHTEKNSELAALVSDDPEKRREVGEKYGIERTYSYEQYDECLRSGEVDAVYIALPNHLHCDYTLRAAEAGVHVLCEKPMAVTEDECERMIRATRDKDLKLMIAYRLHFEQANLKAIELVGQGELGEVKVFESCFSLPAQPGNIRVRSETGGGTLYDIGIYCINAARYLFRAEPSEVFAMSADSGQPHLQEVDETTSAVLRFPGGRIASFTSSFGVAGTNAYRIVGTKGDLRVEPAYDYAGKLAHHLTIGDQTKTKKFSARDQFAPEILYFSQCILRNQDPEPSGEEGLADVRIIRALYQSSQTGRPVRLEEFSRQQRPDQEQEIHRPAVSEPELVNVESPTGG